MGSERKVPLQPLRFQDIANIQTERKLDGPASRFVFCDQQANEASDTSVVPVADRPYSGLHYKTKDA